MNITLMSSKRLNGSKSLGTIYHNSKIQPEQKNESKHVNQESLQ